MRIIAQKINSISPASSEGGLAIDADLTSGAMRKLFYQIWEYVGESTLDDWMKEEGREIVCFDKNN